jgi:hypothetical protein
MVKAVILLKEAMLACPNPNCDFCSDAEATRLDLLYELADDVCPK